MCYACEQRETDATATHGPGTPWPKGTEGLAVREQSQDEPPWPIEPPS